MKNQNREVWVIGGQRIPFVKSQTIYDGIGQQEILTQALRALVTKYGLERQKVGEVVAGAVLKHPRDFSLVREAVLGSGLDPHTPAFDLQKACGTGLSAAAMIANEISIGQIDVGIAGGSDTNSEPPLTAKRELVVRLMNLQRAKSFGQKLGAAFALMKPSLFWPQIPAVKEARTGLSMGESCELMVREWGITREAQDQWAYESHHKASIAYEAGFFDDMMVEYKGIKKDGILRADTTVEKLGKLRPAFANDGKGTLTAGNSTPLSDGASAVLLSTPEYAKSKNWTGLARVVDYQSAAVDYVGGEGLLMAPTYAVSELLKRNNLKLQDFDFYEIHEAFAGQVLCTLKAWESEKYCQEKLGVSQALGSIDRAKINVKGSSLAVGHPFAATGGRIVHTLAKLLHEKGKGRGLISICTAGGQGVAMILEAI
ncbi:3-ketoacyl-CoA thiolase [compost metagenome]